MSESDVDLLAGLHHIRNLPVIPLDQEASRRIDELFLNKYKRTKKRKILPKKEVSDKLKRRKR